MISQSRDGDFVSDVVARIGWVPCGLDLPRREESLQEMIAGLRNTV